MKTTIILLNIFISASLYSQEFIVSGMISNSYGPLSGVVVTNTSTNTRVITANDGKYILMARQGTIINFSHIGYQTHEIVIQDPCTIDVKLKDMKNFVESISATLENNISTRNFWVGAKIGYNFNSGNDETFFIGSATISLNLLGNNDTHHTFGVVGNIGNFKFNQDSTYFKNVQKVAQSLNGLSVGLGYTHETSVEGHNIYSATQTKPVTSYRQFLLSGLRLTSFKNISRDSSIMNFSQFVTTAGIEIEQTGFINGGSLTASGAISLFLFDKNVYYKIFNKKNKRLITYDFTMILPISKTMGIFINSTFAGKISAIYVLGMIFKS